MSQLSDRERDQLLQRKRERREELKRKKLEEQGQAENYRGRRLLHIKKSNLLLSGDKKPRYVHVPERYKVEITFPKVFSFIDDPEGTLSFFNQFKARLSKRDIKGLHFNHSGCSTLGLDALTLTDALLMEETERRGKQGMTVGGTFPTDLRLKIMFKAIGTLRMMQHPEMELEPEIEDQVVRSDLYGGNAKGLRKSQDRDKAATSLVEYLDRVLRHQDHLLTPEGHRYFGELISEVIGNAEEHSGRWYTRAFSQPGVLENGQQLEQCHLVIINFGKTIFESLSARGSSHEVRKRIDALVEHHTRKRFFQPKWDEECLWTIYALQQGVSRYADTRKGPTRGNGTIRMIEAFSRLAVKPQKMCILSGSAFVMYDGTYKLYEAEIGGEKLSQISFNKQSDLAYPPDGNYVFKLKNFFQGSIISLRFSLNSRHLDEVEEE